MVGSDGLPLEEDFSGGGGGGPEVWLPSRRERMGVLRWSWAPPDGLWPVSTPSLIL